MLMLDDEDEDEDDEPYEDDDPYEGADDPYAGEAYEGAGRVRYTTGGATTTGAVVRAPDPVTHPDETRSSPLVTGASSSVASERGSP